MSHCVLIVTADDLGLHQGVNAGIAHAHLHGIVTSASLMVHRPAAASAAQLMASLPRLAVGLHLDLGEWVWSDTQGWVRRHGTVDPSDGDAVQAELDRQIGAFVRLTGRTPAHLDGHQHVQREDPVGLTCRAVAAALDVPLRGHHAGIGHIGSFHGQDGRGRSYPEGITPSALSSLIEELPDGVHELGCHPGLDTEAIDSPYAAERAIEVAALCHTDVRKALHRRGVELVSTAAFRSGLRGHHVRTSAG